MQQASNPGHTPTQAAAGTQAAADTQAAAGTQAAANTQPPARGDDFLRPTFDTWFLDRYIARSAVLRELSRALPELTGRLLDVGCGQMPYRPLVMQASGRVREYVGLDMPSDKYGTEPDVTWDGARMPFADATFDSALATEVLEHCPRPELVLGETARVLRPGGVLFLTVPFLWPLHEAPHDHYRYTPFRLQQLLSESGFSSIELRALGGWDAALAQMIGLWVRRRPLTPRQRSWASKTAKPLIGWLLRRDRPPTEFREGDMITGLAAIARK